MTLLILLIALIGYILIIFESQLHISKTVISLITASLCWIVFSFYFTGTHEELYETLISHFGSISGLLIFLLGAMTVVELIDLHKGFSVITNRIRTRSIYKLIWIVGILTFFLSSFLDNLATTIVMILLMRKILPKGKVRMTLAGIIVLAANAGGAFSPIGDVTTTLLWIGGQVSAFNIVTKLFIPSLVSIVVPLFILSFTLKGFTVLRTQVSMAEALREEKIRGSKEILFTGIFALLMVPVIKSATGLPPFIGILFGLSLVSLVSVMFNRSNSEEEKKHKSMQNAFSKVDVNSIFYFMGILLLVTLLEEIHVLADVANYLNHVFPAKEYMVISIGFLSSIIDNGSLVAATQGMFPLSEYPMDNELWEFIALCSGIGGSMLIIGSAAGIVAMEKEKITFNWYLKNITPLAVIGYIVGIITFLLMY
ncbi:MAG: sodium:proton antiporter NhaD [Flavobacteriales bacterium]|nr:sodium:proton antiporter NhaD [Flavobacteriales bacterium]